MIKQLQKYFKPAEAVNPALAEQQKEDVTMTTEVTNANTELAAMQATVESLTEQLARALTENAELTALVEAATEFKTTQEKAAVELKIATRTSRLETLVGTEQTANLQGIIATMDDAGFEAIATAMSFKANTEAASAAFTETGVDGNADATQVTADAQSNRVKDYLKAITKETQAN